MSLRTKRVETRRDEGSEHIGWAVVGPEGAIEFWCYTDEHVERMKSRLPDLDIRRIGGVETHSRRPFDYSTSKASPDHEECPVLEGECWHDGSSLWATESWIPSYEASPRDDIEWIWLRLERVYDETWPIDVSNES